MASCEQAIRTLGLLVVMLLALLVLQLGIASVLKLRLSERAINSSVQVVIIIGLLACVAVLTLMLVAGTRHVVIEMGDWVKIPAAQFHFSVKFVFDRLSVPLAILSFLLTGTISAFGSRYMHREPGYNRFFVLFSLFVLGMVITSLGDTIETLFAGWELVGLSSALLVAFYQERPAPPRNGLWIWSIYRVSDAALMLAAVVMHHLIGEGDFDRLLGSGPWPDESSAVSPNQALAVG